jgi:hypothetical protein
MPDPKVVLTKETLEWLEALAANGAFTVDAQGAADFSPDVMAAVKMLHEIIAGGAVQMTVTTPGNATLRAQLDGRLQAAMDSVRMKVAPAPSVDPYVP